MRLPFVKRDPRIDYSTGISEAGLGIRDISLCGMPSGSRGVRGELEGLDEKLGLSGVLGEGGGEGREGEERGGERRIKGRGRGRACERFTTARRD